MPKKEFKNPFESVKELFAKKRSAPSGADGEVAAAEKHRLTGEDVKKFAGKAWSGYSFIFIFVAIFIIWVGMTAETLTWNGVMNNLRHSAVIGLIAIGMGLVIITGGIDLSVGSTLALVGGLAVQTFNATNSVFATFIVCLILGTALGFVNGFLIGKIKMPAFIVTLGTMLIYRSIAQYYLRAALDSSLFRLDATLGNYMNFFNFGNGFVATIPNTGLILIAVTILFIFVANRTKYGRHIYATGSNEKAAYLSGVNVDWIKVSVYAITGGLAGFAAFLWLGMNGSVDAATIGKNNEMYAIAAAVIGGIAMTGGRGKIVGVLFGALTYTLIDKIIAAAGVDALINDTIKGIILLGAVFLQLVGPMLKGVKLTDQVKEICGKWFAFGKTKKQLAAEAAEGGESALPSSEDDAGSARRRSFPRSRGGGNKGGGILEGEARGLTPPRDGRAVKVPYPVRGRVRAREMCRDAARRDGEKKSIITVRQRTLVFARSHYEKIR